MASTSLASVKDDFKTAAAKIAEGLSKPVTTISTICIKCGDFIRLTLSVLKKFTAVLSWNFLQPDIPFRGQVIIEISDEKVLSVDDMKPSFLEIGSDLDEATKLSDLHNELRAKLETKQASIEELLTKADRLVAEQPENRTAVYEAMAESLGATWKDMNDQLNLRDNLLQNAVRFYTSASKHQDQLNIMENFLQAIRSQDDIQLLTNADKKHKEINNGILETAVETMTFGDKSIQKIREIGSKADNLEKAHDIVRACMKIEAVMLTLNDKRKQLDTAWEEKKVGLEWSKQSSEIYDDLQKIEEWVRRRADDLRKRDLGVSDHTTKILLREHEIILKECQEMVQVANRLHPLNKQILEAGYKDGGNLSSRCENVRCQMGDLLYIMEDRRQLLHMEIDFFRAANLAMVHLESVSYEIKALQFGTDKQNILRQHADLSNRIQNAALPALSQGQNLIEKVDRNSEASKGIDLKLRELKQKYEQLLEFCSANKAEAILRSQAQLELQNKYNLLNSWLNNVGEAALYSVRDMGTTPPTAADFLERHKLLANDMELKRGDYNAFINESANIGTSLVEKQSEDIKVGARNLKTIWEHFHLILEQRTTLGETYYEFHKSAKELNASLDGIDELLQRSKNAQSGSKSGFDNLWAQCTAGFQDLKRQAENFVTYSRKMNNDMYLNIESAQQCVEDILECLGTRQLSLGRSWIDMQAKAKIDQELAQSWDKLAAECENVIHHVMELKHNFSLAFRGFDEKPPSRVALRQQTTLNELKSSFKRFEENVETLLRTVETTSIPLSKGPQKEQLVVKLLETLRNAQIQNAHYEVLTGMTVTFFQNLQKIDDWIERVAQKFRTESLSKLEAEGRIDQLYQEHKAVAQTMDEFIRFAQSETEQILNQARKTDVPDNARKECESLPSLIQERILRWNDMCTCQSSLLEQYNVIDKFEREIKEILETIEILTTHIREMKHNMGLSQQAHQAAYNDYRTMETRVHVTDQRVSTVLATAESYLSDKYRGNKKLRDNADSLNRAWSAFRQELEDLRQKLAAADNYWTLIEESETWIRDTTEYIVETGWKTKELKSSKDVESFQTQVDMFMKPKAAQQEKRLREIEHVAHIIFGEDAEHKVERYKRRYKEIVDSLHMIGTQLKTLKETLISSEEAILKEIKEMRASPKASPPKFVDSLKDGQVTEGSRFEFICQVQGKPEPDVSWYKDGIAILNNPDYKTTFSNGVCTLKIEETMTEDASVYTCRAYNPFGSAESVAKLIVKESPILHMKAPEFVKKLHDSTIHEGESHVFECVTQGNPAPVVSWYKNDRCIDQSNEHQITTEDNGLCKLIVYKSSRNDNAVFKCRAVNPAGESSTGAYLTVTAHQAPKIVQLLNSITTTEGGRVTFEATVTGEPSPEVTWWKDSMPVLQQPNCRILRDSSGCNRLIIESVSAHQSGRYYIKASNKCGEAKSEALLQVSPKTSSTVQTNNQVITEEFLECHTESQSVEQPQKLVSPASQMNQIGSRTDQRVEEEEQYITDRKVTTVNGYSENHLVAPHFTETIASIVAEEGCEVKFDGTVTGNPEPEVLWTKNSQQLSAPDYKQSFYNGHTSLTIPRTTLNHSGKYVCAARNPCGLATSSAQLVVTVTKEAPDFIERLISQEVEEGGPLRWQVKVSGNPPPKVTWLKNDEPLVHSHEYQTVDVSLQICISHDHLGNNVYALYVPHCRPTDSGQFTCRAENDAGEARSAADLVVRRRGEPARSYVHVTRVYTKEHNKDAQSSRSRLGPEPFMPASSRQQNPCPSH